MKDLSKEERLEQQILEKSYIYGKKKWLRIKRTFLVLSGGIYLIFLCYGLRDEINISNIEIEDFFYLLVTPPLVAAFLAVAIMFISLGVWSYVLDNTVKERIEIAKLEGELYAIELSKNDYEDEKIKELERHIDYLENYYANKCDDCTFLKLLQNNTEENE